MKALKSLSKFCKGIKPATALCILISSHATMAQPIQSNFSAMDETDEIVELVDAVEMQEMSATTAKSIKLTSQTGEHPGN